MSSTQDGFVVVGIDGSPDSIAAVKWADHYANATGARLQLVSAWEWAMAYGVPMMFDGYQPDADAQAMAEKARADVTTPDDRVEVVVRQGSPGPVLTELAKDAQALVVGSHGHSAISAVLLGSVSSYCLHHATCPIVVVR